MKVDGIESVIQGLDGLIEQIRRCLEEDMAPYLTLSFELSKEAAGRRKIENLVYWFIGQRKRKIICVSLPPPAQ
jgi:hypothetical protein